MVEMIIMVTQQLVHPKEMVLQFLLKTGQNSMIPVAGMAVVLLGIGAFAVVRSRKEI